MTAALGATSRPHRRRPAPLVPAVPPTSSGVRLPPTAWAPAGAGTVALLLAGIGWAVLLLP